MIRWLELRLRAPSWVRFAGYRREHLLLILLLATYVSNLLQFVDAVMHCHCERMNDGNGFACIASLR